MKLSLSTNWFGSRLTDGEAIAEAALALGFDELELGYRTQPQQIAGFRRRLDQIPVGSVHAFCPVPISAPEGHPELYSLVSFNAAARDLAYVQVVKNLEFAADIGADTLVLHAGRVGLSGLFSPISTPRLKAVLSQAGKDTADRRYQRLLASALKHRQRRSDRALAIFRQTVDRLLPDLQRLRVTLALENMPYLEGFPDERELASILAWETDGLVKGWFDTGHDRVRRLHGWIQNRSVDDKAYAGMHLNDVNDLDDDHFAPGGGKVNFAALKPLADVVRHVVFEPNAAVSETELRNGIALIRRIWQC